MVPNDLKRHREVSLLKIKIISKNMREKQTNKPLLNIVDGRAVSSDVIDTHHVTRHNTPIHNILSTDPQLSSPQKALETLPEDGNVMPKHVGATIHN
jgi:23S rRNA U2552 (ribose-2'-O)-methylase RlmE/FtsJ